MRWNLATKGANVTVPTAEEIAGGAHPASLRIAGAGTIMSCDGVVAGAGEEVFWQVKFSETGRGSWVGLVPVPVAVEDRGAGGVEGGGDGCAARGPRVHGSDGHARRAAVAAAGAATHQSPRPNQ